MANAATKNIIIGGGNGFVGQYIKQAIARRGGANITVVSRKPGPGQLTWNDIERHGLPADTVSVVNVAGQNILDPFHSWDDKFKKLVWDSRVETNKILTKAVLLSNARSYVTISGVAYYPPDGKDYDENIVCEKYDYFSELTEAMEAAAKLPERSKCRQVTIRSGVVLAKDGGMIRQIWLPFFFGLGGPIGSGTQPMPWIHAKDLGELFVHAMSNDKVNGVLNGVAPQIITNKEFSKAYASSINRPAIFPLPSFVVKLLFSDRAKIMLEGQRVKPTRTLQSGFKFKYDTIEKACAEMSGKDSSK